ncbi:MAG: HAMP domain-containing protein [Ardenticatenaceae bacterium]|nr:HAMP domain-containing protein [Ardenticatenaceae bacterium]
MVSTQNSSEPVALLAQPGSDSPAFPLYSQLNLRTKLILPYLLLAMAMGSIATYGVVTRLSIDWLSGGVVGLFTAVPILLLGHKHATQLANPVEDLMIASLHVAAGNYSVVLTPTTTDEIGQLTDNFNWMATQLKQHHEAQLLAQMRAEGLLGQYVGNNIAQHLLSGQVALGGQQIYATVLFADIRNFTQLSEQSDLGQLTESLNDYYTLMQSVIETHGGVINKFGGDSLLAIFGAPIPHASHPQQAMAAALAMVQQLEGFNRQQVLRGKRPFSIGIGINSGDLIVGNFGSEQRREYTVLGDTVNVAKRLSDLNKERPFAESIFVSEATVKGGNGRLPHCHLRDLGDIVFKGKGQPTTVYAVGEWVESGVEVGRKRPLAHSHQRSY